MQSITLALLPYQGRTNLRIFFDVPDAFRQERRLWSFPGEPGVAERAADRRTGEGDDGDAMVHGLHQRHAEALVLAGTEKNRGAGVIGPELPGRHLAREMDTVLEAVAANFGLEFLHVARNPGVEAAHENQVGVAGQMALGVSQD